MKTSKTLLKEEYNFDMIQKSNRNSNQENHILQLNYLDNKINNQNIEKSKKRGSQLLQANKYITGLVNDLKESISLNGYEDNIFQPKLSLEKLKRNSKRISLLKKQSSKNYKNTNSLTNSGVKSTNSLNNGNSINISNIKNNNIKNISFLNLKHNISITSSNKKTRSNSISSNKIVSPNNKNLLSVPFNKKKSIKNYPLHKSTTTIGIESDDLNIHFNKKSSFKTKKMGKKKLSRVKTNNSKNNKSVKFDIPEKKERKSISKIIRRWSEQELKKNKIKKLDKTEILFSFLLRPEYFEDTKRESQREKPSSHINEGNEKIFKRTKISNKNILELNDITNDLKKSFILTPKSGLDTLKKTYIEDQINLFDDINLSNLQESENEEEKVEIDLEKYRELQKKGLVYDSLDEYNDQDISNYFIRPEAKFLIVFDFFVFISTFYCLLYYPFFLGVNNIYCRIGNFWNFPNLINLFVDVIFIIDFIIHNFIGYYNPDDILQTYIIYIIIHNLKRWFVSDLIAALPIKTILSFSDLKCKNIGFLTNFKYTNNYYYLLILLRLIKIAKVLHKNKFLIYLDEQLDKYEHYNYYYNFYKLITLTLITVNLVSCVFIFLGKNSYPSWIINFGFQEEGFFKLYFLCNYYLIETVTTVGYGDLTCITVTEKVFGIIMEFGGIIAYSWIITSISNYVKIRNDQKEEYFNKYKILEDIRMKYPALSDDLFERINRYIKHKQNNENQEKNLIDELPISLKNNLVYSMYKPIINNFIFFKNFDNKDFIVRVIFCFKPILAIRNDILVKDGDFIEDIIFVKRGKISLELPIRICENNMSSEKNNTNHNTNKRQNSGILINNSIIHHNSTDESEEESKYIYQNFKILDIRKNEHFGDVLMFSNERCPLCAIVKSRKAELFYLKKSDALEISQSYPQIFQTIIKKSLFNMQQIRILITKVIKIFNDTNGITTNGKTGEFLSQNDLDLQSIPTISDNYDKKNNEENGINNLNTIKENENASEESSIHSKNKNNPLHIDSIKTEIIKINSQKSNKESDFSNSSEFTQKSHKSKFSSKTKKSEIHRTETRRLTHLSNNKIDFSERYSDDILKQFLMSDRTNYTPYKPEEINNEIYPNENFMEYNKNNNIAHKILNKKTDISVCSTEISFSISSKYENIDELSDYRYSKTPKLRKVIKLILKDQEFGFNEVLKSQYFTKIKSNKIKSYNTLDEVLLVKNKKTVEFTKFSTDKIFKKKKNKSKYNQKKFEFIKPKKNCNQSDLNINILNDCNNRNNILSELSSIEKPTFTNFFHKFIVNEIQKTKKEVVEDNKADLTKTIKRMESIKKNLSLQNNQG